VFTLLYLSDKTWELGQHGQNSYYATGWTIWGLNVGSGRIFLSFLEHPHWLWGPPSLLLNTYWVLFP